MSLPLPEGVVALHIGPQKTGTTALQEAFHAVRGELAQYGVHYAGRRRLPRMAAMVAVEGRVPPGRPQAVLGEWPELLAEVAAHAHERVLVSAEIFADAKPDRIRYVLDSFGPRTHVVITARALAPLLPSQWQQYVQNRLTLSYDDWLRGVLADPPAPTVTPSFWRRHRTDLLAGRWAEAAGPENVTVVVLDEADRTTNLRAFEALLGLPAGLLVAQARTNRSLSTSEIEFVRALNVAYAEQGWPADVYERLVRYGLVLHLRDGDPPVGDPPLVTPGWALEAVDEVAAEVVDRLSRLGVNIMGDPALLRGGGPPPGDADDAGAPDRLEVRAAVRAVIGLLHDTAIEPRRVVRVASRRGRPERRIDHLSSAVLLRTVGSRAMARIRSGLGRRDGGGGSPPDGGARGRI